MSTVRASQFFCAYSNSNTGETIADKSLVLQEVTQCQHQKSYLPRLDHRHLKMSLTLYVQTCTHDVVYACR